jgi:hypothetical protein
MTIGLGVAILSIGIWLWLLGTRGQFWRCQPQLEQEDCPEAQIWPTICAVIPARNEADLLPATLRSLLTQDYPGKLTVFLVDDHSTDGTAEVAIATATVIGKVAQLQVLEAAALPSGWSGKLWAMDQGVQSARSLAPDYILFTDADIQHDPANLRRLVNRAIVADLDLVSVMVRLRCESFWEIWLIPAFVFFFQKLYPFSWVNTPDRATAAAAGGCILMRRAALDHIGGISTIRQALIDDCALAQAVKSIAASSAGKTAKKRGLNSLPLTSLRGQGTVPGTELSTGNTLHAPTAPSGKIWLGLSDRTLSLRPYPSLKPIWNMVARTAYTQLNYSPSLLLGTLLGMTLIYLVPPLALLTGLATRMPSLTLAGSLGWLLMTLAYLPTVRLYRCPPLMALGLPVIAALYTLMTLDSAVRHWRGQGGAWKGRVYSTSQPSSR